MPKNEKLRLLTGDTPTGRLHLGHWVGSLENRVALQDQYECFFIVANTHAFTTRVDDPASIRQRTLEIILDYLSVGIDPKKSTIFIESDVPAIFELTCLFSMLIPYPRLMRNPTIKDEIRDKKLGDNYSMGLLLYPIMQVADILGFKAHVIPVGEDQLPLIEMTREVARRFNQLYCGVNSHISDQEQIAQGGLFPIPEALVGRNPRLVGTGGPGENGQLLKMSKSLQNAILLSDPPDIIRKKIMSMYTDPKRLHATDPGTIENNPLWIFHEVFNPDKQWVEEAKSRYRSGTIGDVECKKRLIEIIVELVKPFQETRKRYENDQSELRRIVEDGAKRANAIAKETLEAVKNKIKQHY